MRYYLGYYGCLAAWARSDALLSVVLGRTMALLLATAIVFSLLPTVDLAAADSTVWVDYFDDSARIIDLQRNLAGHFLLLSVKYTLTACLGQGCPPYLLGDKGDIATVREAARQRGSRADR